MINDNEVSAEIKSAERMAELQGKLYKLRDFSNDKKWTEARSKCSEIEEDLILLWHWYDSKIKK